MTLEIHMVNLKTEYGQKYKVHDDGTDDSDRNERLGCQEIPGRYGKIYPYGEKPEFAVYTSSAKIFKRLERMGLPILQRGDTEGVFTFERNDFDSVAMIIQARERRKLTVEQKTQLVSRLKRSSKASGLDSKAVLRPQGAISQAYTGLVRA